MKFELDPDERVRLKEWRSKHLLDWHGGTSPYAGAIGGGESFILTPTGLGTIVSVQCSFCFHSGKPKEIHSECLTDFDEW